MKKYLYFAALPLCRFAALPLCRFAALLLFFLLSSYGLIAQDNIKSTPKYTITFDVATRTYTSMPTQQIKELTTVDKVSLRLIEEKEHHDVEILNSNEMVTTIKLLKSNKYENWMQQPAKTVLDKDGSRCYNEEGGLLAEVTHSDMSKKSFDEQARAMFKRDKVSSPDFLPVSLQAVEELRKNGFTVNQGKKGRLMAKSATKLLVYDPTKMEIEERDLIGDEVQYSLRQKFTTNELGQIVPDVKIEVILEKGRADMKFWRTVESKYANYKMVVAKPVVLAASNVFDKESELLKVNPNPAQNDIWVQIPRSMQAETPTIRIFDVNGKQVFSQISDYVVQQIAVNQLPIGVYLLQVETAKGAKVTQRFVKQ
jgi:Secretion system C-terminal sorting domain